jgi:hypothetical protein
MLLIHFPNLRNELIFPPSNSFDARGMLGFLERIRVGILDMSRCGNGSMPVPSTVTNPYARIEVGRTHLFWRIREIAQLCE